MAEPAEQLQPLPQSVDAAFMLAMVFRRLGGSFSIGSNGVRYFGRPEPVLFRHQGRNVPQLADARPHERFHSPEEWTGAIKLIQALLLRLGEQDFKLVFDLLASVAIDERKFTPSVEGPTRGST